MAMAHGHIYAEEEQENVVKAVEKFLAKKDFKQFTMTREAHPTQMKEISEKEMRLYWVSPPNR